MSTASTVGFSHSSKIKDGRYREYFYPRARDVFEEHSDTIWYTYNNHMNKIVCDLHTVSYGYHNMFYFISNQYHMDEFAYDFYMLSYDFHMKRTSYKDQMCRFSLCRISKMTHLVVFVRATYM